MGIVLEALVGDDDHGLLAVFDGNCVVHKVLGAAPSVTDGGENRVYPFQPVLKTAFF